MNQPRKIRNIAREKKARLEAIHRRAMRRLLSSEFHKYHNKVVVKSFLQISLGVIYEVYFACIRNDKLQIENLENGRITRFSYAEREMVHQLRILDPLEVAIYRMTGKVPDENRTGD